MPLIITLIGVFILILTAYVIVHPSPMFDNKWELYSWKGLEIEKFLLPFEKSKHATFALSETREHVILTIENSNIEPMYFDLENISWYEVNAQTKHNNLIFYLTYNIEPYEHCKLLVKTDDTTEPIAELVFISVLCE